MTANRPMPVFASTFLDSRSESLIVKTVAMTLVLLGADRGTIATAVAQAPVTAFVNTSVVPMDRERVLAGYTVLVRGDQIIALGPAGRIRVPAGATRIDGRKKILMPGLANMHAHLQVNYEAPIDSVPPGPVLERLLLLYLADGVTTVRNMIGRSWHLRLRQQVARGELLGPRIYTAGSALGTSGSVLSTPAAAVDTVTAQYAAGYDFLKIYHMASREIFDSVVAAADRLGMPYAGHVPTDFSGGLEYTLHTHFASAEHLYGYREYLIEASGHNAVDSFNLAYADTTHLPAIAAATRAAGLWNVPTLLVYTQIFNENKALATLNYAIVRALHAAGAGLLLGTDGGVFDEKTSIVRELEALVAAGLTPYQALETGTRNVAAFFGTLDSTGTVAMGKRADLLLLSDNPLVDVGHVAHPVGVMVGGHWLPRAVLEARLDTLTTEIARSPGCQIWWHCTP